MEFKWDETKARGTSENTASRLMKRRKYSGDDYSSCVPDPDHSDNEERFLLFGVSEKGKYLTISFTETEYEIRLISARQMTLLERKAYEQR